MSRISQDFINNLGFLYESVHVKDQDFLNEESEYYDAELTEFVADILSTISSSMVCEGYSAEGIFSFLEISSDETIIEKYLNFDESFLTESVVEEGYIEEQLYLFDSTILEFLGALGKGAINLIGRVASKPARMAVAKKIMNSKDPIRTAAAVDRWARTKLGKSGFNPNLVSKAGDLSMKTRMGKLAPALGKIRDIARGAKGFAKNALLAGTGVLAGYAGAKLGSGGSGQQDGGKQTPSGTDGTGGSGSGGGTGGSGSGGGTGEPVMRDPVRPSRTQDSRNNQYQRDRAAISTAKTPEAKAAAVKKAEETGMAAWAKAHPELAAKVKPGQSGYDVITKTRLKPGPNEKQDQTPTIGKPEAQIDKSSVEADIKREQERLKKKAQQTPVTAKESYDSYDVILEYLIDTEQVDTLEEAHYVMLEMDAETVGDIIEEYEDYLLAEEIEEWVNDLLDEGYDLSEYTWDEIVEYYVTEGFKPTGYHHDFDPYRWDYGRNQSTATSPRGRRIQKRVRDLEDSGDQKTADRIHKAASNRSNQERGLAKQKRNKRRGPGPRRARQDAMRDMSDSGFA
jgi:hypothetical protein